MTAKKVAPKVSSLYVKNATDEQLLILLNSNVVFFEDKGVLMYDLLLSVSTPGKDQGEKFNALRIAGVPTVVSEKMQDNFTIVVIN